MVKTKPHMQRLSAVFLLTASTFLVNARLAAQTPTLPGQTPTVAGHSPAFAFRNGVTSTGWIDFDFNGGARVIVPAKINGHEAKVLLLTGEATSKIDKSFAASIGLQPTAAAGTAAVQIQFGDLTLQASNDSVMDLGSFSKLAPFLLGDDLFNNVAVDIDFAHHRIAFRDPNSLTKPPRAAELAGAAELPLIRCLDARSVPVSIEGGPPVQFEFFLGDPSPLAVYQAYYQSHHLLEDRPTSLRLGGGIGGGGALPREAVATLKSARFAGVDFMQIPAVFPADSVRGSDSQLSSGNIGLELISRFRVIIDYPHDRLYALPDTGAIHASFSRDRLGLVLKKQDTMLNVLFVSPGSPAEAAGFRVGDKITQINEKPLQAWSIATLSGALRPATAGTVLTFTLKEGDVRRVKLIDYF